MISSCVLHSHPSLSASLSLLDGSWLWGSQQPCQEDTQAARGGPTWCRTEACSRQTPRSWSLLPTKTWVSSEGDSIVCQAWNDSSPCCSFDVTLLRDPEPLPVVTESPGLPNQLPSSRAHPTWPLGYETMLNEYVIVCTLTEWNFLRKVTVLKFHTNANFCLKTVLVRNGNEFSKPQPLGNLFLPPSKEWSHAW